MLLTKEGDFRQVSLSATVAPGLGRNLSPSGEAKNDGTFTVMGHDSHFDLRDCEIPLRPNAPVNLHYLDLELVMLRSFDIIGTTSATNSVSE